jgi:hypothetical protein
MADEKINSADAYTLVLLDRWNELIKLREDFRRLFTMNIRNKPMMIDYTSRLSCLWLELLPKVRGRTDLWPKSDKEDFIKRFEGYAKYYKNPREFFSKEGAQDIFNLEMDIREVLEKVGITDFERGKVKTGG